MATSGAAGSSSPSGSGRSRFGLSDAAITSFSGAVSGFAATFAKQPIQRLKWIRQVDSGPPVPYNQLLRNTLQSDGVLGLFRGSLAGIMRNVPHSALVYTVYPEWEALVLRAQNGGGGGGGGEGGGERGGGKSASFSTRFFAGFATLTTATLVTHPLDTIRVRISVTYGEVSAATIMRQMVATGGAGAFYQGFGATLLGAGPRGAVGFGVFETLKDVSQQHEVLPNHPTTRKLLFGYLAGLLSETVIYPIDTVRRRQQALGHASPLGRHHVFRSLILLVRFFPLAPPLDRRPPPAPAAPPAIPARNLPHPARASHALGCAFSPPPPPKPRRRRPRGGWGCSRGSRST